MSAWAAFRTKSKRLGQYNSLNEAGAHAILDVDVNHRDDETGTWFKAKTRSLGEDDRRDARVEVERQGNWGVLLDYNEIKKSSPYNIWSPNPGGTNQFSGGPRSEKDLEIERKAGKIGLSKKFGDGFEAKGSFKRERKEGERNWGAQGPYFLIDPIDYTTDEVEGTLGYTDRKLQVLGGYLGSFFHNENKVVNSSDTSHPQEALALGNQAHQLHLTAGYNITPTTRTNMKLSYGTLRADENFYQAAINGRKNLDGRVDTTLFQWGLTAKPLKDLSTQAKVRYEDRNDMTPRDRYISAGGDYDGYYVNQSRTTKSADFEAGYQLPWDLRLIQGFGVEDLDRGVPTMRSVSYRASTTEYSSRTELRSALTDTVGGSVAYIHAKRMGSDYLLALSDNRIDPIQWADRDRDKMRVTLDWQPASAWSTQLMLEGSQDHYDGRALGPREGSAYFASLDVTYKLNRDWDLSGWASIDDSRMDQATRQTAAPVQDWAGKLRTLGRAIGLSARGQLTDTMKVGIDLQQSWDRSEFNLESLSGLSVQSLPDITYRQSSIKLFADYEFVENNGVRLNYGYFRTSTNDWTYAGFNYNNGGDSTMIGIPGQEDVHYTGLTFYHRW
ncbi:MAG: MtrB/PioB family decaheme-associated outer membrane protein [Magnetospirillum sp.]|nr:MtrB/PioB family decaheme-associated outer membrane protein [Magnetospirillum sp.]